MDVPFGSAMLKSKLFFSGQNHDLRGQWSVMVEKPLLS